MYLGMRLRQSNHHHSILLIGIEKNFGIVKKPENWISHFPVSSFRLKTWLYRNHLLSSFLLLLVLGIGCHETEIDSPYIYELKFRQQIVLPKPKDTEVNNIHCSVHQISGKEYLLYGNRYQRRIELYDILSRKLEKTIRFKDLPADLWAVKFLNWDSIFVYPIASNRIILFDSAAQKMNEYLFDSFINRDQSDATEFNYLYFEPAFPIEFSDPWLLIGLRCSSPFVHLHKSRKNFSGKYNIVTGEYKDDNVVLPAVYYKKPMAIQYQFPQRLILPNRHYFSFSGTSEIYIVDGKKDSVQIVSIQSDFLRDQDIEGYEPMENEDPMRMYYHFIENGSYAKIIYDKFRNKFYRIVRPKTESWDSNSGSYRQYGNRKASIMIMDENLTKIGETEIPIAFYDEKAVVGRLGLYLIRDSEVDSMVDKNSITIDVFFPEEIERND